MSTDLPPAGGHRPGLDAVRGVAVALVILVHQGYLDCGWMGVQVFFVLSGYLITGILLRDRQRPLGDYLGRFYWRRTLRIFPLYYGYLFAFLALDWLLPSRLFVEDRLVFHAQAPFLLTYTINYRQALPGYLHSWFFHHFWSLAIEEQFYLVWPLVVFALPERRLRRLLVLLVIATPLLRLGAAQLAAAHAGVDVVGLVAAYALTPCQLDSLGMGALLATLEARRGGPLSARWCWAYAAVLPAVALIHGLVLRGLGLGPTSALGFPSLMPWNLEYVWGYSAINLGAAGAIGLVSRYATLGRMLDSAGLGHLGQRSYGVYVLHLPLLDLWGRFAHRLLPAFPPIAQTLLYYFALLMLAELSFRLWEAPFLRLKERPFRAL